MKKLLFLMVLACLAFGCKDKEFDLPKPLTSLRHTRWIDYDWNEGANLYISDATGRLYMSWITVSYNGEGRIESIDEDLIVFSEFIIETDFSYKYMIEKAEYRFENDYLHLLTVYYRENENPQMYVPNDPFAKPVPMWSNEIKSRDFILAK
jgi:hypothetical protein